MGRASLRVDIRNGPHCIIDAKQSELFNACPARYNEMQSHIIISQVFAGDKNDERDDAVSGTLLGGSRQLSNARAADCALWRQYYVR
jgi:hypothetical protein